MSWIVHGDGGFVWAPTGEGTMIYVSAMATINGRGILGVDVESGGFKHPGLQISVSPAGRSIRVFDVATGLELKGPR